MPLKYAKLEYKPGSDNTGHVQMERRTDVTKKDVEKYTACLFGSELL